MSMLYSFWQKKVFWNIRVWELCAFIGLHLFMAILYDLAILLASGQQQMVGIAVNYFYKIVLTAPVWAFFFRTIKAKPFFQKMLLHIPICAVYVGVWLFLFYTTVDYFDLGRIRGTGVWWDVYIPVLGYFVQFAVFHAYSYWNELLRQQQKEKDLLRLAHAAELNTLKAQIQPHFLFNTLNSISASVPSTQEHTRTMIAQLADVFRFAMSVTDKQTIPLKKELHFIKNFLALEKHRFGDRLSISYDVDKELESYPFPPMLLQPLVENAIKHGIAGSVEGGRVLIRIATCRDHVFFEVHDTGRGINGSTKEQFFQKGIGLENIRQRLRRLYNTELLIENAMPQGFSASFMLPIFNKQ